MGAHAALARFCELKLPMRCSAAAANAANNDASLWSTFANAHAAFARPCELKSLMRCSAAALEYPPQALNVGKVRKHMNRDQCKT